MPGSAHLDGLDGGETNGIEQPVLIECVSKRSWRRLRVLGDLESPAVRGSTTVSGAWIEIRNHPF